VSSLARNRISQSLNENRYLTISQIASLFYSVRKDGQPPKPFPRQPRKGQYYELVPGYDSARQRVLAMADTGEVKLEACKTNSGKVLTNVDKLIMFPKDRPPSAMGWQHEIDRGDIYVALHKTGKVIGYRHNWHIDEYRGFAKSHKLNPDGRFELEGSSKLFFLEVDRGTEFWSNELDTKIEKYAALQDSMPQNPFVVLFTIQTKPGMSIKDRASKFNDKFHELGRGHQFAISPHEMFLKDPLGNVLDCYLGDEPTCLTAL
jgi:Replication-relaxation